MRLTVVLWMKRTHLFHISSLHEGNEQFEIFKDRHTIGVAFNTIWRQRFVKEVQNTGARNF